MRKVLLLVATSACIVACSQQAVPPPAHIVGTNSLVTVNNLLFVTSPGANELRVLDLRASPRDFVRAPNPLEPLSIPVLNTPAVLARDIDYNASGDLDDTTYDPYVYVQGAGSAEISIVGSRRDNQLVELKRLVAPGIVTAIAARAPPNGDPTQASTLYFATLDAGQGSLWQLKIPPTDPATGRIRAAPGDPNLDDPQSRTRLVYSVGGSQVGEPISSIVVLPNNPDNPNGPRNRIAIASRSPGSTAGRTIILDTSNGRQWVLDFPSPVRQLVTHPAVYHPADADGNPSLPAVLPAGARIFGVLDEDACAPSANCPGILAVDGLETLPSLAVNPHFTRRSLDASGAPMVTLRYGPGLISALSLAPPLGWKKAGVSLNVPTGTGTVAPLPFDHLGVVTTSNGLIYFVDANALNLINIGIEPQATSLTYVDDGGTVLASSGFVSTYVPGPIPGTSDGGNPYPGIKLALGAALDEFVSVTYEGTIPGFRDLPTRIDGGTTELPFGTSDRSQLRAGADRIVVSGTDGCGAEVRLTGVDTDAGVLTYQGAIPCSGSATFSVRAAGTQPGDKPYVVEGTVTGYMGRTGNNADFAFPTSATESYRRYYYHPPPDPINPSTNFNPINPQPQMQFSMGPGDSANPIQRDWRYVIGIQSNYLPEFIQVDSLSLGIEFHSPGASAFVGVLPDKTDVSRLYVAYPSANAILELQPQNISPNVPNGARFIAAFR